MSAAPPDSHPEADDEKHKSTRMTRENFAASTERGKKTRNKMQSILVQVQDPTAMKHEFRIHRWTKN